MKAKTIRPLNCHRTPQNPEGVLPAGSIDAGPESWKLVVHGVAIPEDEECRLKAGMTPEQMAERQRTYNRLAAGIHPDDWAEFDRGEMVGYDEAGRKIPGPNFVGSLADFEASADASEDEVLS
jgi:hypothetical protein